MSFIENIISNFIDKLSVIDISCIMIIYAMFLLYLINVRTNFRMINIAKYLHTSIFILTATAYIYCSPFDEKMFAILANNRVKITYFVNTILLLYYFYNKKIIINDDKDKNINYNFDVKNNAISSCINNGIYDNYNYYYSNKDRYAEPYTSKSTNYINNSSYISNSSSAEIDNNCSSYSEFNLNEYENKIIDEENDNFNVNKIIVTNYNNEEENNGNNIIVQRTANNSNNNHNYYYGNDEEFDKNILNKKNNEKFKKNILNNVTDIVEKNNSYIDEKFNLITNNMIKMRDSIQGTIDRMTKIFELFSIISQKK